MRSRRKSLLACTVIVLFAFTQSAHAFLEDLCLPRRASDGTLSWCLNPNCITQPNPNVACLQQAVDFATLPAGRSMVHADSTYFIALALGYRADVAYWIAAYNEVTDYAQYVPIDQCGVQAANVNSIQLQNTVQTAPNSGRDYITAAFNGFQRTNVATDGPLDHYVVNFSPNGQGTDVHGAGGVQSLYPFHYPQPGYPARIDDTYQKTLANLRQWGMLRSTDPGLLCTVGLLDSQGTNCLTGGMIVGSVPLLMTTNPNAPVVALNVPAGKKVLDISSTGTTTYYEQLGAWLADPAKTTGKLWKSAKPAPVPVQIARFGLYLHALQDTSSHATYCGDGAPTPPGGCDPGTYMYMADNNVALSFSLSCATGPHLAGHVQETGTGTNALPLRVYVALNNTVDELIAFGNTVAKNQDGWIANPELLPPDVVGGKSAQGQSADDLKTTLVGKIVSGTAYSRAEVYQSGVVTLPLQQTSTLSRLHAMNAALAAYGDVVRARSANPARFAPFEPMPGNSANPNDTSVCWKPIPSPATSAKK
jgi:hypothetical protein